MNQQRDVDRTGGASPVAPAVPVSLLRRFGALVIDWLLCVGVSLFFVSMTRTGWLPPAILIVEYAFFIGLFTQTPGMRVLGLRCVSFATNARVGVLRAGLRGALLCLVLPALLMDGAQRGLHDRLAGTVVIPARPA